VRAAHKQRVALVVIYVVARERQTLDISESAGFAHGFEAR
jgi:hypothetical protein